MVVPILPRGRRAAALLPLALCLLSTGCFSLPWQKKKDPHEGLTGGDSMVLGAGGLERYHGVLDPEKQALMDAAHRHFLNKDYAKAEPIFGDILKEKKLPINVSEEALYYRAECQYQMKDYREAAATFRLHLKNYRNGAHAQDSIARLFQIADYWLEPTRQEMQAKAEGHNRWFTMPKKFEIHLTRDMPVMDVEGHALISLEDVRLNDIGGQYGEQACFYLATVKFFREQYRDADYFFTQLYEHYPNSKLAPKAIKQAIICKQICTGGSCYDCRTVQETRKLLDVVPVAYPTLAKTDQDWIERQLVAVNLQQADRDFNIAEFYRRTGHPGPAYFYYELVRRCYPNTDYSEKAQKHMTDLRGQVERERGADAASALPSPATRPSDLPTRLPDGPAPVPAPTAPPRTLPPEVGAAPSR